MAEMEEVRAGWARLLEVSPDSESVAQLTQRSRLRRFETGDTIIGQEGKSTDVLLLLDGGAQVVRLTENGHQIWLSDLPAGSLVGDMALLIGTARTSDVIAAEDVHAVQMSGRAFESILKEDVVVAYAMTRILARRLKTASDLLVDQIALDVMGRLYALLVRLGQRTRDDDEVLEIRPAPSVISLAERIHATREAASRALGQLRRRRMVVQEDGYWRVIQPSWMR